MKVDNNISKAIQDTQISKSKDLSSKAALNKTDSKSSTKTDSSAKVNVSEKAQMMSKMKDVASNQSVDEAKVARLQKLIDAGEYKVNAESVADKLVDEHLLMS